ncbi:subtilisin-like protein [Lactarius psammicola]|nr:subtilisin-like protein [Lactarius psammicola]
MRHHWLSSTVLSVLSVVPLAKLTTSPAQLWGKLRVKHAWDSVPANWECLGPPPNDTTIDLYIALQPHRENALIEALYEVSNPDNENYGVHLSKEQVVELVTPHEDTLEFVYSWLEHYGVPSSSISTSHGGGWLTITGVPVSQADKLLCASYRLYRHTGANGTEVILRTVSYAIPAALHGHVQTIAPTTLFASPRWPLQTAARRSRKEVVVVVNATSGKRVGVLSGRDDDDDDDGDVIKPLTLRRLYKTEAYVPAAAGRNELGILGLRNEYPRLLDLLQFMINFREDAVTATFSVFLINGGKYDADSPGQEANLDIQYSAAIIYPTPQTFYSTGGPLRWSDDSGKPAPDDPYLAWLSGLLDQPNIPQTILISYGNPELSFPREYTKALCDLFAQLGARGVTVLVSTGDDGVGRGDCKDSSGNVQFMVSFPASCPFVTSVGATKSHDPEVALPLSGGGFSRHFPRETYQDRAVSDYFGHFGNQYAGLYNPGGRGIPDISAQGHDFVSIVGGAGFVVSGTSCSSPTVAGIMSLLNDYRISTDKPPLGFLNPWLYSRGIAGLNDITSGSNPGCQTDGFSATAGWDPVTGLGTPDFVRLKDIPYS